MKILHQEGPRRVVGRGFESHLELGFFSESPLEIKKTIKKNARCCLFRFTRITRRQFNGLYFDSWAWYNGSYTMQAAWPIKSLELNYAMI